MSEHRFTNALAKETSPYLLQHAHNPVQWYPWSGEALSKAKEEDKPILLSIGYSACHWCHVMEQESFEDEETARLMNENFVNIKVDREERPDLDAIYMNALQLMTGRGGWPMTLFLTPDQIPFYCGTYFPREDSHAMPSFRRILVSVARAYREKRELLYKDSEAIVAELKKSDSLAAARGKLSSDLLETAASKLIAGYDSRNGGFGQAPKFPPAMALHFLMRLHRRRKGKGPYLDIVERTLTKMACGGICDQLGGGFHRYSVDAQWLVPHFEKMLYDNALLSRAYLDAYLLTQNDLYRRITQETLDYVAREMTSPEGGFYSSQDADSEGQEGFFFLWSSAEVQSILGEDAELFSRYYGISQEGNFEGKNILWVPSPAAMVARLYKVTEERLSDIVASGRQALFKAREARIRPGRDEKVLTAWNAMMLQSFAEAANALDREDYRQIALRNAEFLLSKLLRAGRLLRSYMRGQARFNAYLEDYACLIDGLLSLYEATFDSRWILHAEGLAQRMVQKFWDPEGGGFYFTSEDHESLIHRPKDFYDNATPSGNSAAARGLLRLWKFTGDSRWSQYAVAILEALADLLPRHPSAFPHLLGALDFLLGPTKEIAIVGHPRAEDTKALLRAVFQGYSPNKVVSCGTDGGLFLLRNKPQIDGMATAYVCENFTCSPPVTSPKELGDRLV